MSDLLEFAGTSELSDTWGTLKEFEFLQDIPRTNLEFWWKADDITTAADGDAITTLTNIAGTGDPTQGTLANRAIYRTNAINGKPALQFDGINDHYTVNGPQSPFAGSDKPFTIYAVYTAGNNSTTMQYLSMGRSTTTNTSYRLGHQGNGNYRAAKYDDSATFEDFNFLQTLLTPIIRVDYSPGTTYSMWENETSRISNNAFNVGTMTINRFTIGCLLIATGTLQFFEGLISEVLVYSEAHSTANRLLVTRYLKNKYRMYV